MAGLLPAIGLPLGVSVGVSSDVPATGSILTGGQTGPGTGTPSTSTSRRSRAQSSASAKATPSSSLAPTSLALSSSPSSSASLSAPTPNTPTPSSTPSQTPSQTPTPTPSFLSSSSLRPLTTFVVSTTTNLNSTPTPSISDLPPLPSPTSIPVEIPISTPILTPSPTPSFIPPPPVPLSDTTLTPTPTPTPSLVPGNGIAAPSQAEQASGGSNVKLMPALPIALGSVGGVLIFGLILGMLYRKSKWPFHGRRNFAQLDELEVERQQEMERQNKLKWDPRMTRAYKPQGPGVNF